MMCSAFGGLIMSMLLHKGKMNIEQILNATLAGGVMIGGTADMLVSPFVAMIIGFVASIVSTCGFHFLEHFVHKYLRLHDTCGIAYLHFLPGFIGGLIGCLVAGVTPRDMYGEDLGTVFPMMGGGLDRTTSQQGGIQVAHVFTVFGIALFSGIFTGLCLRIPIWDCPINLYNDKEFFKFSGGDHDDDIEIKEEKKRQDARDKKEASDKKQRKGSEPEEDKGEELQ